MISRPCGDRPSVSIVCSIAFNNEIPNVQDTYPPYDIVRTGEETYRISLALAGFTPEEITVTAQQNRLTITGTKGDNGKQDYIYQSIAARPFERNFNSMLSDGFVEALWETMIALATAAGICVSVISLAAHLNETRAVRSAGEPTAGVAGLNGAPSTSHLN